MHYIITVIYPGEFRAKFFARNDLSVTQNLQRTFAEWNHGSGCESDRFLSSHVRSLAVGDVVSVNGTFYQCRSTGWAAVTPEFVNELEAAVPGWVRERVLNAQRLARREQFVSACGNR